MNVLNAQMITKCSRKYSSVVALVTTVNVQANTFWSVSETYHQKLHVSWYLYTFPHLAASYWPAGPLVDFWLAPGERLAGDWPACRAAVWHGQHKQWRRGTEWVKCNVTLTGLQGWYVLCGNMWHDRTPGPGRDTIPGTIYDIYDNHPHLCNIRIKV